MRPRFALATALLTSLLTIPNSEVEAEADSWPSFAEIQTWEASPDAPPRDMALWASPTSPATIILRDSPGGNMNDFISTYSTYKKSQTIVIVDGYCYSACTLVLSLPRACATDRAVFGFHRPWWQYSGQTKRYYYSTLREAMLRAYPTHVRKAIALRGGLRKKMFYIKGTDLLPECNG